MDRAARPRGGPGRYPRALLRWFRQHQRPLPWRTGRDPYRVWVAEVLLQQTRVAQAVPYFERFIERFPTVRSLGRSRISDVLKVWEGAGYYARARHLHAAARQIVRSGTGRIPETVDELERLPGVGPYIARAIASLAFGRPVVALEANGLRVATRWFREEGDPRSPSVRARLESALSSRLPNDAPGAFNEAIMELGETICRPTAPRCDLCPVSGGCRAYRELPDPGRLPRRRKHAARPHLRGAVVVVADARGRWLVQRRPLRGLLGGLWEFPGGKIEPGERPEEAARRELHEETGISVGRLKAVGIVRHTYSHFSVELHVFEGRPAERLRSPPRGRRWVRPERMGELALPKATHKIIHLIRTGVRPRPTRNPGRAGRTERATDPAPPDGDPSPTGDPNPRDDPVPTTL